MAWAGDQSSYQSFVDRHGLTFTNLDDTPGDVYFKYKVPYQPAWVFLGTDGSVSTRRGALSQSDLETVLAEL